MNQIPNIGEPHNTREIEEIVEQFEKRMPLITSHGLLLEARLTPTSYLKMKEWLRTTLHQQLQKAREESELAYRGAYRSALLDMMNVCIDSNPAVQKGWNMAITNMLSMFEPLEKPETPWGCSLVEKLKKTLNFRKHPELDQDVSK